MHKIKIGFIIYQYTSKWDRDYNWKVHNKMTANSEWVLQVQNIFEALWLVWYIKCTDTTLLHTAKNYKWIQDYRVIVHGPA
jgi:hypothetical protein